MTITTEEAEALAAQIEEAIVFMDESAPCGFFWNAAGALRTLAAERDIANEQIYGLSEERERWKERAERAEAEAERLRALVPTSHQTSTRWTIERERPDANEKPRQP